LHDVFRVFLIAGHTITQLEDTPAVALCQDPESVAVAAQNSVDQSRVALFHSPG
jgi:hypothetical protein